MVIVLPSNQAKIHTTLYIFSSLSEEVSIYMQLNLCFKIQDYQYLMSRLLQHSLKHRLADDVVNDLVH